MEESEGIGAGGFEGRAVNDLAGIDRRFAEGGCLDPVAPYIARGAKIAMIFPTHMYEMEHALISI